MRGRFTIHVDGRRIVRAERLIDRIVDRALCGEFDERFVDMLLELDQLMLPTFVRAAEKAA